MIETLPFLFYSRIKADCQFPQFVQWRLQVSLDAEMLAVRTSRTTVVQVPRSAVKRIRSPIH